MQSAIDRTALLARLENDWELLRELVELFLKGLPKSLSSIQDAITHQDADALGRAAHKLKGEIGNFTTLGAYETLAKLEAMGYRADLSDAGSAFQYLEKETQDLALNLQSLAESVTQ